MRRSKALGRSAENLFKLSTKMGIRSEIQFRSSGFARITLRDKLLRQPALQLPKPLTRRTLKMLFEDTL